MEKKTSFFLRLPTLVCSLLLLTFSAAVFRAFRVNCAPSAGKKPRKNGPCASSAP